jgi:hypothetical protein
MTVVGQLQLGCMACFLVFSKVSRLVYPRLSNMLIPYLASNFFVDEVGLTLKHIPRKITVYDHGGKSSHNWPADAHTVIRITSTKTRKEWYLDFSGVQFGIYRTLWGCTEFKSAHRAVEIEGPGPFPFGTCRASLKEIGKMPGPGTLICGAVGEVAEHLNTTAAGWATDRGIVVSRMLALDDGNFDRLKVDLLATNHEAVRKFVAANDFRAELETLTQYERQRLGLST